VKRREFITLLGSAAAAWPLAARAQQPAVPVIAFVTDRSPEDSVRFGTAFHKGLSETGVIDGQNATVEYHWLDGQYDQLPLLMADLVRRRVAVIAAPGSAPALAAKSATNTIPIIFGVAEDPVKLGLVDSFARPGGNATGANFVIGEVVSKQLGLLHELLPKAVRIAVLVNPGNATNAESTSRDARVAARTLGLQAEVIEAGAVDEIDAAFAKLARDQPDALFVGADAFLASRRVQLAILAARARTRIPMASFERGFVEVGALMSYGTHVADVFRQVGAYAGRILKGAKPTDLPVIQPIEFEFLINASTAKAFGLDVPPSVLLRADEVIE
jgi:putative ABC transport system substrate-binding protein